MSLVADPPVLLILGTANVGRVLKTLNRSQRCFPDAELVVVAPAVQRDQYQRRGWSVLVAGERWLRLEDPRVNDWLEEHSGVRVVIPLAWPRNALRFVSRFIRDHPEIRILLDWPAGIQRSENRHGTTRGILAVSSWLLWAPRYALIRVLQFIDGIFMIAIQHVAGLASDGKRGIDRELMCHVITSLGTGGAQRQLIQFLRHSNVDRSHIVVVVLWRQPGVAEQEISALGVRVINLESEDEGFDIPGSLQRGFRMMIAWWRLHLWLRKNRPQTTFSWLFLANVLTPSAARLAGIPMIISSVRNLSAWKSWPEYGRWWFRRVDRLAARLCGIIVVNARAVRDDFVQWSGVNKDRVVVIPNSVERDSLLSRPYVDIRHSLKIAPEEMVVVNVARWVPEKRQDLLIQAVSRLTRRGFDIRLVLVGHGESEFVLRSLVAELGLGEKVVFTGRSADPQSYYRGADLVVLSSTLEGMPNIVLEAQVFGLPIVATKAGGTEEALVDGETGLLVECDDLEGLTAAMARVLGDSDLRRRMGEAGAAHVEQNFDAKEMARRVDFVSFHGKAEEQFHETGFSSVQEGE